MSNKKLKEVTANVFKRIMKMDICMPSDYLNEFKKEIHTKDIEDIVSHKIKEDLNKSQNILKATSEALRETSGTLKELNIEGEKLTEAVLQELSTLIQKIDNLSSELHFDELTKAKNRRWLFNEFLKDSEFFRDSGSIAFIDLNKFKDINDNFGHITGDKTLIYLVHFLKEELLDFDKEATVVRFAGDEFIILFKKTDGLTLFFNRALSKLKKQKLKVSKEKDSKFFKISFSYGVSNFNKNDSFLKILDKIDNKMYLMKKVRREER